MRGKAQVEIQASPERVYELVSDVTRMGEWSPECRRGEWLDGATGPAVGVRFRGHNRRGWLRWSSVCTVTEAEPGWAFAFETITARRKGPQTRWRYEMKPLEDGTLLTESFEVLWYFRIITWLFGGRGRRQAQMEEGMGRTLARIKTAAEASSAG